MDFEQILASVITLVVVPLLTWAVKKLISFLDAKIDAVNNETAQKILDNAVYELGLAVETAVNETAQTYVDALKKDGKFTKEEQQIALNKTIERVKQIASNMSLDIIDEATGALNERIQAMIEAEINGQKVVSAR